MPFKGMIVLVIFNSLAISLFWANAIISSFMWFPGIVQWLAKPNYVSFTNFNLRNVILVHFISKQLHEPDQVLLSPGNSVFTQRMAVAQQAPQGRFSHDSKGILLHNVPDLICNDVLFNWFSTCNHYPNITACHSSIMFKIAPLFMRM